MVASFSFLILG